MVARKHAPRVAVIGECLIELNGEPFGSLRQTFGGDTLNTALYVARIARELINVSYISVMGVDILSEGIVDRWRREGIDTTRVMRDPQRLPGLYFIRVDEHGVNALGVRLSEGKTFDPSMIELKNQQEQGEPPFAIVSRAFALALFPGEKSFVGKDFYDDQGKPLRIVGVIEHMHGSWVGWDKLDRVMLIPRITGPDVRYLVRTAPGELDRLMTTVDTETISELTK